MSRTSLAIAATLAVAGWCTSARALVLSEDPLEGDSTTAGASLRFYHLVLAGGPLSAPFVPRSSNPAAVSLAVLRPELELKRSSGLSLVVHDELMSMVSSVPTALLGGSLSLGEGAEAPLYLPLQSSLERDGYSLRNRVAWAYARYATDNVTLSVGRQPITLGRGHLFTPEDLIAPFSPLQIDTEFKPGVDAARVDLRLGEATSLTALGAAAKHGASAVLSRGEVRLGPLRLGAMAGFVRTDWVLGSDLFADLGHGADLHAEATVTAVTEPARRPSGRHAFERAVIGTTAELSSKLHVTAEAYYNGAGARTVDDYFAETVSPRVALGEAYTLGRLYTGVAGEWDAQTLVHVDLAVLANLEDPSAMIAPMLRYGLAENVSLIAGANLPLGRPPNYATGRAATEFGLYPSLYHLDAKLWF